MEAALNVSILIPFVDRGDAHRRRAYEFVVDYWRRALPDAELVVQGGDPFDWGAALNEAARRARGDVLIHSDPDSVVSQAQILEAIGEARRTAGIIVAFDEYLYLTEHSSQRFTDYVERTGRTEAEGLRVEESGHCGVGNVVVYSRATWYDAHGYDERFGTWGGADGAFAWAAEAFTGSPTRRVKGPMFHLWHPRLPESKPGNPGYAEQFAIVAEYRDAAALGPEHVRELVLRRDGGVNA